MLFSLDFAVRCQPFSLLAWQIRSSLYSMSFQAAGMSRSQPELFSGSVDNEPFRTATKGPEMRIVDGVRVGTAASWFRDKLNTQDDG